MKKKIMSKNNGITMVSLAIVVTVILILTGLTIYNVRDSLGVSNLKAMQNDIQNLRDMVSNYYSINGKIPAKIKYTNTENIERIRNAGVISEKVDIGDFYIIDLKELENLTLNYGEDYKHITDTTTEEEASQYEDIYIINETSQNIFYVGGIKVDEDWFYTDYTSEDVDTVAVNLRYFDGVKIPDGFYYVGGTKEEGLVISDVQGDDLENSKQGNQFVWIQVNEKFEADEDTYATDEEEFVNSVNQYKGFYIGRFEAGIEGSTSLDISELGGSHFANTDNWTGWTGGKVVSKKDVTPWNYVTMKYAMNIAESMYGDKETNFKTRIYSKNAYDAVLKFLEKEDSIDYTDWGNCYESEFTIDSNKAKSFDLTNITWTNISQAKPKNKTLLLTTGASERNKVKNIYDLAGNVQEYTTYKNKENSINYYGSSAPLSGKQISASNRLETANFDMGFRIVLYIESEENWSQTYDEEGTYKDKNGDTAYIPKGFQVSQVNGENTIDEGLVIRNATTDDRYVWIEVPKSIYTTATSETDYANIEKDMQNYTAEYKEGYEGYSDTWYSGCGISSEEEYNNLKNKMLTSVYNNGGFYISQYEIGADSYVTANDNGARLPVSKEGMYPYNYVTVAQAQQLATNMDSGEKTSSLMFGVQWDLVLKFLETKGVTTTELTSDSSSWGNFRNIEFLVPEKNKYVIYNNYSLGEWQEIPKDYIKPAFSSDGNGILLSTGATNRNSKMNIYDLAGNVYEWTLDKSDSQNNPCTIRGGGHNYTGNDCPCYYRHGYEISINYSNFGFRTALY